MNTIHLDLQGKTARVLFQALPQVRPKPSLRQLTKCGTVSPVRILNGLNSKIEPTALTAQDVIAGDPEIIPSRAGEILELEALTAAYFDPEAEQPSPVADFKQLDIVYDPAGQEKERRPHISRKTNLDELQ